MAARPEEVMEKSREMTDLLTRLSDSLSKAEDKNDALMEGIETAETRAMADTNSTSDISVLRNLRARLAACHIPNAALKQDIPLLAGIFQERFKSLETTLQSYKELNIKLLQEAKESEEQTVRLAREKQEFNEEREKWNKYFEQQKIENTEQSDRLELLSRQLTGTKQELEAKTNDLASRRIAFEEEKLLNQKEGEGGMVTNGETESLRRRLREQALKNVELERALLCTEVTLHQRDDELISCQIKNKRLLHEVEQLRNTSSKAVKQFEKRTIEANKQLAYMSSELTKAQDNAKRFQDILSVERRKQKALQHTIDERLKQEGTNTVHEVMNPVAHRAYIDTLTDTLQSVGKRPQANMRVQDMIRKNEVVLVDNARLKADIHKLKIENADLLRRVRLADCNVHHMRNQVVTNLHDRAELMKKLDRVEQQYKELQYSLTRQANDWVHCKQNEKNQEKERHIQEIKPISTLGASERTWIKGPSKVTSLSREIHVNKW